MTASRIEEACFVDLTKSIHNLARGVDGIARVELAAAAEVLAAGGRAGWVDRRGNIFEIDAEKLRSLLAAARRWPSRANWIGPPGSFAREFALNRKQTSLLRKARGVPFSPRGGECFLLFGAYWDRSSARIPAMLSRLPGARVVGFIHDMVPVRHPELTHDEKEMREAFPKYLASIVSASQMILANSEFTAAELRKYCEQCGWKAPDIKVVHLASDLDIRARSVASARLVSAKLKSGNFALMVSTFEPRKNHRFAVELWRELESRSAANVVPLVFAGKPGWLDPDLFEKIQRSARQSASSIVLLESPSDEELCWLYQHAKFTIYPSKMEGWGLPVCESLSFGTHCLAADNSALREASQGLAWHGPLEAKEPWLEEIGRCIGDPGYLAARSMEISRHFKKRRWRDFAKDLIAAISN
jgi:glycosyltransferase involved in cell wall biosynthesis